MKKTDDGGAIDSSLWSRLPPEIIDHVLFLLPLKSLCRFKSVSPSWNTLISSPHFAQTHFHITYTTHKPQKTLLISPSRALYSVDFAQENPTARKLGFPASSSRRKKKDTYEWISVSESCNGLVLISDQDNSNFLFNPFTGECKKLPESPFSHVSLDEGDKYLLRGLGYDSSTDDYKVLMLLFLCFEFDFEGDTADVAVYSLKTDSWRIIQVPDYIYPESHDGFYFNERLHWLCLDLFVVAFDMSREVFRKIKLPASYDNSGYYYEFEGYHMEVLGGCLCLVVRPDGSNRTGVWMMKKYGVRASWTKFMIANPGMTVGHVLCLSSEGKLVLKSYGQIVDVNGEILKGFEVRDNYIETLVSPNHGGQIRRHCEASLGENSKSINWQGRNIQALVQQINHVEQYSQHFAGKP